MEFISNISTFINDNWSAAVIFVAVTIVEFIVWKLKAKQTDETTEHLQRDAQNFSRTLEDHKKALERQDRAIGEAFSAQSHVREKVADKMIEGTEALCTRASVLCAMAMPCVAVDVSLAPGERDGSSCLKALGWDDAARHSFDADVQELLGYDENERWWLYVAPEVRLAYSCILAYVRRCLLILNHSFDTGDECDFANDAYLKTVVHEWANLGSLEEDIPTDQSNGVVRKTIDTLRENLLLKAMAALSGKEAADNARKDYERLDGLRQLHNGSSMSIN